MYCSMIRDSRSRSGDKLVHKVGLFASYSLGGTKISHIAHEVNLYHLEEVVFDKNC